ncbi:MAG: HAD hydrolase family protein [Phycisphaerae bacterium]|jgi:3-deoxy-D-manno-octulosonate 8-phosphate phosphatase (KDO 8-P phosphatase)
MTEDKNTDLSKIKMLFLDVDGVLTNGSIILHDDGTESKMFNTLDGHGIRMWIRAGCKIAFLSGRPSPPTNRRAEQLGVHYCFTDCYDKLPKLKEILTLEKLHAENAAYIGDDLPDLPAITYVGFGIAVANAATEVKKYADYVTKTPGGSGAVREVIEHILKNSGKWPQLLERYIQK